MKPVTEQARVDASATLPSARWENTTNSACLPTKSRGLSAGFLIGFSLPEVLFPFYQAVGRQIGIRGAHRTAQQIERDCLRRSISGPGFKTEALKIVQGAKIVVVNTSKWLSTSFRGPLSGVAPVPFKPAVDLFEEYMQKENGPAILALAGWVLNHLRQSEPDPRLQSYLSSFVASIEAAGGEPLELG
jgi:hypothetical protein